MSSARNLIRPVREVAFRPRPQVLKRKIVPITQTRFASGDQKVTPVPPGQEAGANEGQLPHVSEEQAEMDKTMGETPPDIGQGTPVQDMMKRDKDAADNAPQVIKDQMNSQSQNGTGQKRSYTTSSRRLLEQTQVQPSAVPHINQFGMITGMEYRNAGPGHKFPLPDVRSVGKLDHLKRRYDPVVEQVTKSLMRDGKLSVAQKVMDEILTILRTAPMPQPSPQYAQNTLLLPDINALSRNNNNTPANSSLASAHGSRTDELTVQPLPRSTLPLHPIEYLTILIDSVSPLLKIRQQKGVMGGGGALPIPVPLGVRQRRRQAIQWILAASENRREIKLSERVAKELLKVADGSSGVWEKRAMAHRLGVSARSNIRTAMLRRKFKR